MEFLCASGLSISAMTLGAAQQTPNVIRLNTDLRLRSLPKAQKPAEAADSFWTEVSSRYSLENQTAMNPDNRAERVLAEIVLLFGAIGALILAIWTFLPAGPSQ